MSNWYDRSQVIVNASGLMAESVSVSSRNSVEGLRALGRKGVFQSSPRGPLQTNVSVDYYLEPGNEPNYSRINSWKNDTTSSNYPPIRIEIMGITGSGWIERYSVKSAVNTPTKASATYIIYEEMSGWNSTGVTGVFDQSSTYGTAHGWTTSLLPNNSTDNLYSEFDYDCSFNWQPIFVLGKKVPVQMQLGGVTENLSISRNVFKPITFSGQPSHEYYDQFTGIQMDSLEAVWGSSSTGIIFNISGVPVVTSDFSLNNNGYLTVRSSISKYY